MYPEAQHKLCLQENGEIMVYQSRSAGIGSLIFHGTS